MSGSDSDLDYESADEISDIDIQGKIFARKEKRQVEINKVDSNKDIEPKNDDSSENKVLSSVTSNVDESLTELLGKEGKEEPVNLNNEHVSTDEENCAQKTVSSVNDIKECHNTDQSNDEFKEKCQVSRAEKEDSSNETFKNESEINSETSKNESEINSNECPLEKQRVPLRLEKKIQQKQQLMKNQSVEKDSISLSENLPKKPESKSSWGFGNWGTNLLSSAASSVSTFTNQVSQGIGTVLETVENTLGAPSPEELAASLNKEKEFGDNEESVEEKSVESNQNVNEGNDFESTTEVKSSLLPNVSSWTKVLENTGSKVIMGGLDTLELIGKKTYDIITEGDPGLRKKRAAFAEGITLSQILREAKAEADESKQIEASDGVETVHYSQMFDEYQGLVHLEALEMLSKQSQAQIQRLMMRVAKTAEVRKTMEEIKSICENIPPLDDPTDCGDFEDFVTCCKKYVIELNLAFNIENIIKAQKRITDVLKNYENASATTSTPQEIYQSAICSLAEFTAKSMEIFHKLAELILVQPALEPSVEHFATNLTGLTTVMCIEINNLSSRYHHCLDSLAVQSESDTSEKINVTSIVTNLYLEASNSNKYIQDAFLLLVPVLQASLLESCQ